MNSFTLKLSRKSGNSFLSPNPPLFRSADQESVCWLSNPSLHWYWETTVTGPNPALAMLSELLSRAATWHPPLWSGSATVSLNTPKSRKQPDSPCLPWPLIWSSPSRARVTPAGPPPRQLPLTAMALLDLAMQGLAVFGFILFFVLWLMHFMSIIYVWVHRGARLNIANG